MSEINIRRRIQEIESLKQYITSGVKEEAAPVEQTAPLAHGISLIIPVHRGEDFMRRLIQCIERQTLDAELFEVIVVFNGEFEASEEIFKTIEKKKNYTVLYSDKSVARARNMGIEAARFQYAAFLDADDTLSDHYLEHSLQEAEPYSILLNKIYDVKNGRSDGGANHISKEILKSPTYPESYFHVVKNLSLNGAKIIPSMMLKETLFDEGLQNGEDVVLYMKLVSEHKPVVKVNPKSAVYYRYIVAGSLSRAVSSYQFNITDRLNVLTHLQDILKLEDSREVRTLIIDRMRAQAGFMNRYLKAHPHEYPKVISQVVHLTEEYFPFERMNEDLEKRLYISYCFPPYADTSGTVLAKRIREDHRPCDVIHNNMYAVRELDLTLERIAAPFIGKQIEINTPSSFSNKEYIRMFVEKSLENLTLSKYEEIYSRALWPASHVLAFEILKSVRTIRWIAEFSDPLYKDIKNTVRNTSYYTNKEVSAVKKKTPERYHQYLDDNLFNMTEVIPFIFADELVFTNEIQMESMIERFDDVFKNMVRQKSVIKMHPVLPPYYYHYQKHYVDLNPDTINIGYFGNFYETRNVEEIMDIAKMIEKKNLNIKLYIFTSDIKKAKSRVYADGYVDTIEVHSYLRYFEFLNALKDFDCLLINDAHTKEFHTDNPYLPSKFSDCLGSGAPIWIQYEPGSILEMISRWTSGDILGNQLNDQNGIYENLQKISGIKK